VPGRGGELEILFPTLDRALLTSEIGASRMRLAAQKEDGNIYCDVTLVDQGDG